MSNHDPDRDRVYSAEDILCTHLDSAAADGAVEVGGVRIEVETEPRFTDPDAASEYVAKVMAHLRARQRRYPGLATDVRVRARAGNTRAHYEPESATIAIPSFRAGGSWALRGLVVLHELAHHLAASAGHGPAYRSAFVRLLEDIGQPGLADALYRCYAVEELEALEHATTESTLDRIAKLLRQAERTSSTAEQEAFFAKAQQLASAHSVALAVARSRGDDQEARQRPVIETVTLGRKGQRGLSRFAQLMLAITEANDVRCTIRHDSSAIHLHGFATDVAVCTALYQTIVVQMVADAERHLREDEPETEVVRRPRRGMRPGGIEVRPVATITRRLAYYEGYVDRIHERLGAAREQAEQAALDAERAAAGASGETAVALRDKELEVHDFFNEMLKRNDVRGTWRGARQSSAEQAAGSYRRGDSDARTAQLGNEKRIGEAG